MFTNAHDSATLRTLRITEAVAVALRWLLDCTSATTTTARLATAAASSHRSLDLVLLSETSTSGARFRTGAYALWRQHCRHLLTEAGAPDPSISADVLLAALSAEQVRHWLRDRELLLPDLTASLVGLAERLAKDS